MAELRETAWNHLAGEKIGTFYTAEPKWIKRVVVWAQKYPDDVKIIAHNKDGSVLAHITTKWLKISPPRQVSEEVRQAAAERMRKMRADD